MTGTGFRIDKEFIASHNGVRSADLFRDYDALGERLLRRGIGIGEIAAGAGALAVALPSWATGTGGTRFGRFPA